MAQLIASGTTQADSADFTLAAGVSTTLFLSDAAGPSVPALCNAVVQIKKGSEYFNVGALTGADPIKVLSAPGTFRVRKYESVDAFGVDKE